jgi:mlo protein
MAGGGGGEAAGGGVTEITLEYTATWIVASVCSVIVAISLLFERMLHRLGKVRVRSLSQAPIWRFVTVHPCNFLCTCKPFSYMHEQRLLRRSRKTQYEALLKIQKG